MTDIENLVAELQAEDDALREEEAQNTELDDEGNPIPKKKDEVDNSDAKSALALFDKLQEKED